MYDKSEVGEKEHSLQDGVVSLVVGVTGHKDLVPEEVPVLRKTVREFFSYIDLTSGKAWRVICNAQLGAYLAAHSHILLALWDDKLSTSRGGTVMSFNSINMTCTYASELRSPNCGS